MGEKVVDMKELAQKLDEGWPIACGRCGFALLRAHNVHLICTACIRRTSDEAQKSDSAAICRQAVNDKVTKHIKAMGQAKYEGLCCIVTVKFVAKNYRMAPESVQCLVDVWAQMLHDRHGEHDPVARGFGL